MNQGLDPINLKTSFMAMFFTSIRSRPAFLTFYTVSRLMFTPVTDLVTGLKTSYIRAISLFSLFMCSRFMTIPSGLYTLFISLSAEIGSGTEHNTKVVIT